MAAQLVTTLPPDEVEFFRIWEEAMASPAVDAMTPSELIEYVKQSLRAGLACVAAAGDIEGALCSAAEEIRQYVDEFFHAPLSS